MYWWTAFARDRRINQSLEVKYWNDLKGALRGRHIPSYKLQRLYQNKMKVEEYRQRMELYMMRARISDEFKFLPSFNI